MGYTQGDDIKICHIDRKRKLSRIRRSGRDKHSTPYIPLGKGPLEISGVEEDKANTIKYFTPEEGDVRLDPGIKMIIKIYEGFIP